MRVVTFDLEIAREVDEFPEKWEAARQGKCGIASVVLHDSDTGRYHIYGPQVEFDTKVEEFRIAGLGTLPECMHHLNSADLLVGFNSIEFDKPVLENFTQMSLTVAHYDILQEVWKAVGKKFKGYGLGPISQRTLGIGKSGTGEHAPILFKQGRFAELLDYNLNDVYMTRMLYNHILETGSIMDISNKPLELNVPTESAYA